MERQDIGRGATVTAAIDEAELAQSFVAAMQADASLAHAAHEHLVGAHREHSLEFQGRLLCNVLRPRFLGADRLSALRRISEVLAGLLERIGERLLTSDRLLDLVGASEQEREIWAVDPGYSGLTATSRLDSFMVGHRPRFVEYNAESPASIGFCDTLSEVFLASPTMRSWAARERVERFHARRALLDALLWAFHERGEAGTPTVAVVDWDNVLTRRDFELCADYFRRHGLSTVITDPRTLTYRGGKVYCGEERITLIYRRVLLHELLARAGEAHDLLQAYRDGAICVVNSPRSKLLHKKAVFALLSAGTLEIELSDEERSVVDSTVPWTRVLAEGRTTYHGERTDLAGLLRRHQDRFALKPVDDYGGRGVVLGWDTDPATWEREIERGLELHYVVQERVEVPSEVFPVWEEDGLSTTSMMVDTDPLLFRGSVGGMLTRISADPLLNVSAGTGSTTPTFAVNGEER